MADLTGVAIDKNVEESTGGFHLVPEGQYKAVIVKDKLQPTKDGSGTYLKVRVQIVEGPEKSNAIDDIINIKNKSAVAEKIGQGTLKRLCNICDIPFPPQSTEGLYGKPLLITVKHDSFESNKTGETLKSPKIKKYDPADTIVKQEAPAQTASEDW